MKELLIDIQNIAGIKLVDVKLNEAEGENNYKLVYYTKTKLYVLSKENKTTGEKQVYSDTSYTEILYKLRENSLLEKFTNVLTLGLCSKM